MPMFRVILRQGPAVKVRLQEMGLNSRQVQLMAYVREHGRITNRAYRELTGLSDEAARKEIAGLLDLGLLEQVGKGRSTAYILKKRVGDSLAIPVSGEARIALEVTAETQLAPIHLAPLVQRQARLRPCWRLGCGIGWIAYGPVAFGHRTRDAPDVRIMQHHTEFPVSGRTPRDHDLGFPMIGQPAEERGSKDGPRE